MINKNLALYHYRSDPSKTHTIENTMHSFSVQDLDQLIETDRKEGNKPSKILIGYKLFHNLMNDRKFNDEVANSALDASKRKYKKLKIKITTDEYSIQLVE